MSVDNNNVQLKQIVKNVDQLKDISKQLADNDIPFYKTIDSKFAEQIDNDSSRLLGLINSFIESIDDNCDKLELGKESLNDNWKAIGNVFDGLYEKSDIAFDTLQKAKSTGQPTEVKKPESSNGLIYMEDGKAGNDDNDLKSRKRQPKPQLKFRNSIDNTETSPFKPKLVSKPNALKSFEDSLKIFQPEKEEDPAHYRQPYESEIDNHKYPDSILEKSEPIASQPWPSTEEPIWVDTVEKLNAMIIDLEDCPEIAVDLEHHDYRTYYGLVCLMQISNREKDWLVDTLALRDDLQPLNKIFTDPNVVKVFHGAFMDIIWLQRDLGLYIVSLFDTYHASKQLGFPKHSLAYLLERFANFKTNKKYQMADWRIRPLTSSMKLYARADTHFLLNIFDQLKNMLIEKDVMNVVLRESRNVAKRRFEYYSFRPSEPTSEVVTPISDRIEPWRNIMNQYNINLTKKQLVIDLYDWRDKIGRRDDESVRYVMPNQILVALVVNAPTDSAGVLAANHYVTEHVRMNAKEIAEIIQKSLKNSENEDMELLKSAHFHDTEALNLGNDQLTERRVYSNITKFNKFKKLFDNITSKTDLIDDSGSLFPSKMFVEDPATYVWSTKYDGQGKTMEFTSEDLQQRQKLINRLLKTDKDRTITAEVPVQTDKITSETKETHPVETPKKDQDEIIVIRKKVVRNRASKPKTASDENKDVVDYAKADKILVDKPSSKNYSRKRKAYDPYGKSLDEPRPAKKAFSLNRGKNVSYKTKK
ncbi:exosome nuclease subunit [Saccharomycopsis crataegensis]|uniref:Exosome nuclease subunit n=1 Tax=Saccharomycopsis crataegensis TaxID=43959 RepID=A0AAV5QJJ9_9ASCO|nr:exosome nuclease subunit [Saccharomycopsis crataegensis]